MSFGIALLDPDVSVEQSVDRADKAMYAAKAAGRNCTRIWDPSM
jgi:PleD family two-component response regulator